MASGLSAALRERGRDAVVALLRARPDLAVPPPRDLAALVNRACQPGSLQRALEQLDALCIQVLGGLLLLGAPADRDELAGMLPDVDLSGPVERLTALALLWGPPDALRWPGSLTQLLVAPAGLGRSARGQHPDWYDPRELARRLDALPDAGRGLLVQLAEAGPLGRTSPQLAEAVADLLDQRLLLAVDRTTVELPREVALQLRGPLPLGPPALRPPVVGREHDPADVDGAGALEADELLRLVGDLLTLWGQSPAAALRSGGLGVRELRALARGLNRDEAGAGLVVELAHAAGLVDQDFTHGTWMPTADADAWSRRGPGERWALLAATWLDLTRRPELIGARDERDRPIVALSPLVTSWGVREVRRTVLAALAAVPAGLAPLPDSLVQELRWRAPLRPVDWPSASGPILEQAATLGVTARGALTSAGRRLLEDGPAAAAGALTAALPEPLDQVLVQADLTAVAPGPLRADLAEELRLLADTESSGAASVYRFSESSVRRGLDAGRSAADILRFLRELSRTPLPQPLEYLVADAARRYGQLRTAAVGSYLRADDAGLLSEVVANASVRALKLRRIAPTVLVGPAAPARVLEVLRAAGYAPVAESESGGALVRRPSPHRTPARARWHPPDGGPASGQLPALAERLLAAELASSPSMSEVSTLVARLARAAEEGRPLVVSYLDKEGGHRTEALRPLSVLDGTLVAVAVASGVPRSLPLRRVSSVGAGEEER